MSPIKIGAVQRIRLDNSSGRDMTRTGHLETGCDWISEGLRDVSYSV